MPEQGLEHIEEQQPAQPEPDGGGEGDAPLKVDGVVPVGLPGPGTGNGLQNIAGGQLDGGGHGHAAQEDQDRLHPAEPGGLPLFHQAGEAQQEHQRPHAVHGAVGAEQHAPVGEAPAVDHHLQKYLVEPADYGIEHKEEKDSVERMKKRAAFNFEKMGIPIGAKLTFAKDNSIEVEVAENNKVKYGDEILSLTALTQRLTQTNVTRPTFYWTYEGTKLSDLWEDSLG